MIILKKCRIPCVRVCLRMVNIERPAHDVKVGGCQMRHNRSDTDFQHVELRVKLVNERISELVILCGV